MIFEVILTPEAQDGIRRSFNYIHERAPLNAARWLQGIQRQIATLERLPERLPFARERECLGQDLRQLVFKSHRIIFRVERQQRTVYVLYVRHAKRLAVGDDPDGDES